jgi:hypothetical protein
MIRIKVTKISPPIITKDFSLMRGDIVFFHDQSGNGGFTVRNWAGRRDNSIKLKTFHDANLFEVVEKIVRRDGFLDRTEFTK